MNTTASMPQKKTESEVVTIAQVHHGSSEVTEPQCPVRVLSDSLKSERTQTRLEESRSMSKIRGYELSVQVELEELRRFHKCVQWCILRPATLTLDYSWLTEFRVGRSRF